jgi:hypothetical protein
LEEKELRCLLGEGGVEGEICEQFLVEQKDIWSLRETPNRQIIEIIYKPDILSRINLQKWKRNEEEGTWGHFETDFLKSPSPLILLPAYVGPDATSFPF